MIIAEQSIRDSCGEGQCTKLAIYDYARGCKEVDLFDLVIAVADRNNAELSEFMNNQA